MIQCYGLLPWISEHFSIHLSKGRDNTELEVQKLAWPRLYNKSECVGEQNTSPDLVICLNSVPHSLYCDWNVRFNIINKLKKSNEGENCIGWSDRFRERLFPVNM